MNEEERIKEIRARCEAATEGTWHWEEDLLLTTSESFLVLKPYYDDETDEATTCVMPNDAAFIAHSREDIPYLLDHIADLEKQLSESRTEIEQRNLAGDFAYVIGQFTSSQGENGRLKGENRKLKKELAESQRREKAAVDFIKYLDRNYSRYIAENEKFEPWRGPQDEKGE